MTMGAFVGLGRLAARMRYAALLVLLFATPATKQLVNDVAAVLHGACAEPACCAGENEEDSDSTPSSCEHCACCAPAGVVTTGIAALAAPLLAEHVVPEAPDDAGADGFRTQLFRPPAA